MKERLIIGDGDIAEAIKEIVPNEDDKLYFVSGVSNSQEIRESEYQREKELLFQQDRQKHIVYCSSLCIFYSDTRYAKHKIEMEKLIKQNFDRWTILRLGNITWGDNPTTLINSLRAKKQRGETLDIQDVYRYVSDKEEFKYWLGLIPEWNVEMNIPGRRMKVAQIVEEFI